MKEEKNNIELKVKDDNYKTFIKNENDTSSEEGQKGVKKS